MKLFAIHDAYKTHLGMGEQHLVPSGQGVNRATARSILAALQGLSGQEPSAVNRTPDEIRVRLTNLEDYERTLGGALGEANRKAFVPALSNPESKRVLKGLRTAISTLRQSDVDLQKRRDATNNAKELRSAVSTSRQSELRAKERVHLQKRRDPTNNALPVNIEDIQKKSRSKFHSGNRIAEWSPALIEQLLGVDHLVLMEAQFVDAARVFNPDGLLVLAKLLARPAGGSMSPKQKLDFSDDPELSDEARLRAFKCLMKAVRSRSKAGLSGSDKHNLGSTLEALAYAIAQLPLEPADRLKLSLKLIEDAKALSDENFSKVLVAAGCANGNPMNQVGDLQRSSMEVTARILLATERLSGKNLENVLIAIGEHLQYGETWIFPGETQLTASLANLEYCIRYFPDIGREAMRAKLKQAATELLTEHEQKYMLRPLD